MKKFRFNAIVLFLLVAVGLAACEGGETVSEPQFTGQSINVEITKDTCPSVEIQPGMQISWTNKDSIDHTLLIERKDSQGAIVESMGTDLLQPGSIFTTSLSEPGNYMYYCSADRTEWGTITVLP